MIGYLATLLVTIAYLPQVIKTYKTGRCDMSGKTIALLLIAMSCWIVYANQNDDYPLLISSGLNFAQLIYLSYYKLNHYS